MAGVPKKNIAFTWYFKMVDATDFATPETGLTVTVEVSKDGGAFAGLTGAPAVTEIANGWYKIVVAAGDMNYSAVILKATAAGAAQTDEPVYLDDRIVSDLPYQADASGYAEIAEGTATGQLNLTSGNIGIDWAKVSNPTTSVGLSNTTVGIATAVSNEVSANVTKWNSTAVTVGTTSTLPKVDAQAISDDTTAANNLELIIETAKGSDHKILLSTDSQDLNTSLHVDAKAISASTTAADNVESYMGNLDQALSATESNIRGTDSDTLKALSDEIGNLNDPTAATIADAVWNETSTGHVDGGKAGAQMWTDIDNILGDTNEVQTDWADDGRLDALIDAVKAKTDNLPADPADDSDIDGQLGTITTHLLDLKGTGFAKDTHSMPQCLTAAGFSTFDSESDTVTVGTNNDKTAYSISGTKTTLDALNDIAQSDILDDATPFSGANIDQALSTTESNIRGTDSDTLEALSDQLDSVSTFDASSDTVDLSAASEAQIDAIEEDTAELQGLIAYERIAAQVKSMDADVISASALATDAVTELKNAILDHAVDGTVDIEQALSVIFAVLAGDIDRSGGTYTYKNQAGEAKIVSVVTDDDVDRTIS